ncbi:hypothetical protein ACDQ55_16570 [Chitinophaga sp. 30R24]|uniref:hypothetical protein n=1 Tax=Chitinophaga sp. 30R24 TaxID=3248838 RepID=UPI003B90AF28
MKLSFILLVVPAALCLRANAQTGTFDKINLNLNGSSSLMTLETKGKARIGGLLEIKPDGDESGGNCYVRFIPTSKISNNPKKFNMVFDCYENVDINNSAMVMFGMDNDQMPIPQKWLPGSNSAILLSTKNGSGQTKDIKIFAVDNIQVNNLIPALTVKANSQNIGIGTTDPMGYKLAVAGKILSEEVRVKLQANWPDFVFAKDYQLPSLADVAAYVNKNGHLEGVPSAEEFGKQGIELGKMNTILLQKIEEMTLYLIDMKQQQDKLSAENKSLKERLEVLECSNGK